MNTAGDRFKWGIDQVGKGSVATAAKRLGVTRATLYAWMRGEVGNMRAHNLARLCELTKKDKAWYLHGRHVEDFSTGEPPTTLLAMPMVAQRLVVAIRSSGIEIDELAAACDVSAKTVYK